MFLTVFSLTEGWLCCIIFVAILRMLSAIFFFKFCCNVVRECIRFWVLGIWVFGNFSMWPILGKYSLCAWNECLICYKVLYIWSSLFFLNISISYFLILSTYYYFVRDNLKWATTSFDYSICTCSFVSGCFMYLEIILLGACVFIIILSFY